MNDLEHARTGTSAEGPPGARALAGDRCGRTSATPKFGVVDVIAQHDEAPHEELAGDAKALGLTIAQALLLRADQVIDQ